MRCSPRIVKPELQLALGQASQERNDNERRSQTMEQLSNEECALPELTGTPEASRIREGIAEALREGTPIDHEIAWLIATVITPGSGSLQQLVVTGEISPDIGSDLETAYAVLPGEVADFWVAALDGYCFRRRDKGPVAGWGQKY
jgi:hypothetical protein